MVMMLTSTAAVVVVAAAVAVQVHHPHSSTVDVTDTVTSVVPVDARCNTESRCSADLTAALIALPASGGEVALVPQGAVFALEQHMAIVVRDKRNVTLQGNGATLLFRDGTAPFARFERCDDVTVTNLTLTATRPPFSFGVVLPPRPLPSTVPPASNASTKPDESLRLAVNTSRYPFDSAWTLAAVAMHEVEPSTFLPAVGGFDWIAALPQNESMMELVPSLPVNGIAVVTLPSATSAWRLQPGTGLVLRHVMETTTPLLHSLVFDGCTNVHVNLVRIETSPGMGVLAFNCTNVRLNAVANQPAPGAAMAGNADAMHVASCRGAVEVMDCSATGQGDDGLNVHGQYGVVQSVASTSSLSSSSQSFGGRDSVVIDVRSHTNADDTSWENLFARAVFQTGDTVAIRRPPGLAVVAHAVVGTAEGDPADGWVRLTLNQVKSEHVQKGDIIEPLMAIPTTVRITNCRFAGSRASGVILEANNVNMNHVNVINVSAAGVGIGPYWSPFSESPFGSNVSIVDLFATGCGRGHRTESGGTWGNGAPLRIAGAGGGIDNTTMLHRAISILRSRLDARPEEPAVEATAVDGLVIGDNLFCSESKFRLSLNACRNVSENGNRCCSVDKKDFLPCPCKDDDAKIDKLTGGTCKSCKKLLQYYPDACDNPNSTFYDIVRRFCPVTCHRCPVEPTTSTLTTAPNVIPFGKPGEI
eukprot:m.8842 g.8842  ORF g.8842 m.8842 type:complete len:701 (+) comp2568_c0_seq1:203-2305(+)